MAMSKHVLLITNSSTDEEIALIKTTLEQTQDQLPIQLSLAHVVPNLPACYFNIPSMVLLTEQYYEEAKKYLTQVGETLKVSQHDQWLISGKMNTEILRLANKLKVQFILASRATISDLHIKFDKKHPLFLRSISAVGSL